MTDFEWRSDAWDVQTAAVESKNEVCVICTDEEINIEVDFEAGTKNTCFFRAKKSNNAFALTEKNSKRHAVVPCPKCGRVHT